MTATTPTTSDKSAKPAKTSRKSKPFHGLTAAEKRIAIARDAIAQLKADRYVATYGSYFSLYATETEGSLSGKPLDQVMERSVKPCYVCGIGACFASAVRLTDQVKIGSEHGSIVSFDRLDSAFSKKLRQFFSIFQLELIETAYERSSSSCGIRSRFEISGKKVPEKKIQAAVKFGLRYYDRNKRLLSILRNIVRNHGTFVP
jgi:hypothetical protein